MSIPLRFRLKAPLEALVHEMCHLCTDLESSIERGDDFAELLAKWHVHASRQYEPSEFTSYWEAIDQEEFVRKALNPRPRMVEDLAYSEAAEVLEAISNAELADNELSYFLEWLDAQFPNVSMSNLIYWPDEWFDDASQIRNSDGSFKPEAELSIDQILGYAMARSHRLLPGAPTNVDLPFPMPNQ